MSSALLVRKGEKRGNMRNEREFPRKKEKSTSLEVMMGKEGFGELSRTCLDVSTGFFELDELLIVSIYHV